MNIGIVGLGVVGNALYQVLGNKSQDIKRYDPAKGHYDKLIDADIIFICINEKDPTMINLDRLVDDLVKQNKKAIFVIRTTVIPGTTDRYIKTYNRDFVFMPEFITERSAEYDTFHPDKIVIGTENIKIWETLWGMFSHFIKTDRIIRIKPVEAEMAKLALNSLFVIKVVFAEEIYDLTEHYRIDYKNIYKVFQLDKYTNPEHLVAGKDGYRGASGKCLPKDSEFLGFAGRENNNIMKLLETAIMVNKIYLKMEDNNE